jgi:hypothetical protein
LPIAHLPLLQRDDFRLLDRKETESRSALLGDHFDKVKSCRQESTASFAWAARTGSDKQLRALLVYHCSMVEGREGSYPSRSWQFLVYDESGRARVVADRTSASTYRWEAQGGAEKIVGGAHVVNQVRDVFVANPEVAQGK